MAELTREVLIKAEPSTIFAFLIEPDAVVVGHRRRVRRRPGGIYKVNVVGDHDALGEFVEVIENEKVVFTSVGTNPDTRYRPVRPRSPSRSFPRATTRSFAWSTAVCGDAITDHENGWQFFLDRLATVAVGGELVQ